VELSTPEKKDVFFNIRLSREVHKALAALAATNERTIAGEIRLALREHLRQLTDDEDVNGKDLAA
jgi:hypothetical protein